MNTRRSFVVALACLIPLAVWAPYAQPQSVAEHESADTVGELRGMSYGLGDAEASETVAPYAFGDPGARAQHALQMSSRLSGAAANAVTDTVESFKLLDGIGLAHGIVWANGRFYIVDLSDRKVYAYTVNGQRDLAGDFDLDAGNAFASGIAHANGRFHVVDRDDRKVYAYTASGERDTGADFDLDDDYGSPEGITYANGRFFVVGGRDGDRVYAYTSAGNRDASADFDLEPGTYATGITHANGNIYVVGLLDVTDKVYAYSGAGERDATADFELHGENGNGWGIAFSNGRFYVADWRDEKVYAYTEAGERDAAADIELPEDNGNAEDATWANGRIHVFDWAGGKVYGYTATGGRDEAADFRLDEENFFATGIVWGAGRFYVVDLRQDKVYAYTAAGQRDQSADFDLHEDNNAPEGIVWAGGRIYVVDWSDGKAYAYTVTGQRDASSDFNLDVDNAEPADIAYVDGSFHVVDRIDNKVYSYTATGERDGSADFDLHDDNDDPRGIAWADGRFYVVDVGDDTVYVYPGPEVPDESGVSEATYGVNDALPGVPMSGTLAPAALSDGSYSSTAEGTAIALNEGGYFELADGTRYTCASPGGCTIENGAVTGGSVLGRVAGSVNVCHAGLLVRSGESCTYPGTTDEFSVNVRGRGSFLGRLAGIRIGIDNETIDGQVYDLLASHQGEGVWRIDRVAGSSEPPTGGDPGTDRAALMALYNATDGPNWANNTNWGSDSPLSQWLGVVTDDNGRVNGIFLPENQLSGPIPAELGNLSNLEVLGLWTNELRGSIPAELGNLANLVELWLDDNQLSGPIPAELGNLANLEALGLSSNQLSGPIPTELGNLSNLVLLALSDNQLSGPIPAELGNLANLQEMILGDNQLTGCIPDGLRDVANNDLSHLDLAYCEDSGTQGGGQETAHGVGDTLTDLPSGSWTPDVTSGGSFSLFGGDASVRLDEDGYIEEGSYRYTCQSSGGCVIENRSVMSGVIVRTASGTAPGDSDAVVKDRAALMALYNATDGPNWADNANWGSDSPLDSWYGVLTDDNGRVTWIAVGGNQLSGPIPAELGNLSNLEVLSLWANELSGPIPAELSNLSSLEILALGGNQLSGPIPAELGNLSNLEYLSLRDNQLSGSIPAELGNLSKLVDLYLQDNQLSGCIPVGLRDVEDNDLSTLGLSFCGVSGTSPSFAGASGPGNQSYTVGRAIDILRLPEATGGDGDLTYSLSPTVLGLTFNSTARQLTGAPTTAGAYAMTYTVRDGDGDTDTLMFTVTVGAGTPVEGFLGVCQVGLTLSSGQSCTYPATTDEFSVNARGQGSFLGRLAGIRIRIDNETIDGRVYDLLASHQGEGVWRIDRVEGRNQPPTGGVADDHGDDRATATGIEAGSDTEGVLESGDVDYFRVVIDAPGTLKAYTSGGNDTVGRLEDAYGAELGTNDDGGPVLNFRISEDVSAGTYFVRVEGFSSRVTGGYTLRVRLTESDSVTGTGIVDRAALMALYNATDGPNWAANVNWGSDSPLSQWHGVDTDNSGRVIGIDLGENQLSGSIPPELGGLANLRGLYVYDNQLSGSIPAELGGLANLRDLYLYDNQLSGSIPAELGGIANLQDLWLPGNQLSGSIPPELGGLASLRTLALEVNQLSGSIPSELGNLSNLVDLWLNDNQLSGAIPAELGDLSNLKILLLANNQLSGAIPAELGNLSNLEWLRLSGNQLSGCIPDGLRDVADNDLSTVGLMYCGGSGTSPTFAGVSGPGNRSYTVGTAIAALTLPPASGGDGSLTYSLSPEVPGLIFNATAGVRELTGTPSRAGTYDMTYGVRDTDGDTDSLSFTITVTEPVSEPDLVVESASVSDSSPEAGASFTLSATVRNRGDGQSGSTTLRYYRSSNATISGSDTQVGTDSASGLSTSGTSAESISLTAPSSAGAYYYGACVDSVAGESDTDNNCSSAVLVSVTGGETGGGGDGGCVEVNNVIALGEGENCTISQALVDKYSLNRVSVRVGDTARCSGGRVTLSFFNARSIQLNGLTIRCR